MRGRLNNCHGPHSRQAYLGNLRFYGGYKASTGTGTFGGQGFYALIDTEKLCGEDSIDMLGVNTNAGKAINFFFQIIYRPFNPIRRRYQKPYIASKIQR